MSAALKIEYIQPHVIDILGSTKGRDQPIMKMDKAVQLVQCLDKEVLTSDEYVFLDPFCKAGEILLATALVSVLYKKDKKIVSQEEIAKELYKNNRYFGIAPDERHFYLSRRTFYGNEKSHQVNDKHNIRNGAYLSEVDGRLNKDKFQKELKNMLEYIKQKTGNKKIIAVGNPPYQENDGGGDGSSAKPLYNIFIESIIKNRDIKQFLLVIPSRWFKGGRGLENFRKNMICSQKIQNIHYFEESRLIFPTVSIRGGICFLRWNRNYKGRTSIRINKEIERHINLTDYDIIIPHYIEQSIVDKVLKKTDHFLSEVVFSRNPFGIKEKFASSLTSNSKGNICCIKKRKMKIYITKSDVVKNTDKINEYQVVFPKACSGSGQQVLPHKDHFFILQKGQVSTETYSVAKSFKTLREAEIFKSYLKTYFTRFLMLLRKPTHNTNRDHFSWIPQMPEEILWTDEKLFYFFRLTEKEKKYIYDRVNQCTVSAVIYK